MQLVFSNYLQALVVVHPHQRKDDHLSPCPMPLSTTNEIVRT